MKPSKWHTIFDWGGGEFLEYRKVGARAYQFIRVQDMDEACGRDNEGHPKYHADLLFVDLNALSAKQIQSAVDCCGGNECLGEDMTIEARDAATAEMCVQYGASAPLWDSAGGSWHRLQREARKEANSLLDEDTLADAMDRPVNALGSTASEYMRGDLNAAMARGVLAGRPEATLMAKMHGVPAHAIEDARPADWLPYAMGYLHGYSGAPKEESDDPDDKIVPEYFLGYERGVNVRNGTATRPSWIKG